MAENKGHAVALLAHRLRLLVWTAMAAAVALYVGARLGVRVGHLGIVTEDTSGLPLLIGHDLSALLLAVALWRVSAMLGLIERGERFSPAVTRSFRSFALFLLLSAAVGLIAPLLAAMLVWTPPPRRIELPLNFRDIWMMLVTGILFLVARLLDEAQEIEADLDEIV